MYTVSSTYTHTHTSKHVHTHTNTHKQKQSHTHTHIHTHHTHSHTYKHSHTHTNSHKHQTNSHTHHKQTRSYTECSLLLPHYPRPAPPLSWTSSSIILDQPLVSLQHGTYSCTCTPAWLQRGGTHPKLHAWMCCFAHNVFPPSLPGTVRVCVCVQSVLVFRLTMCVCHTPTGHVTVFSQQCSTPVLILG